MRVWANLPLVSAVELKGDGLPYYCILYTRPCRDLDERGMNNKVRNHYRDGDASHIFHSDSLYVFREVPSCILALNRIEIVLAALCISGSTLKVLHSFVESILSPDAEQLNACLRLTLVKSGRRRTLCGQSSRLAASREEENSGNL